LCPEHTGHPLPLERLSIFDFHLCPKLHIHPTTLPDPAESVVGSQPSACAAKSGFVSASEGLEVLAIVFTY
jgi:hypothetical protein